jgi:RNA-directed DNA polymerase
MPTDAPVKTDAPSERTVGSFARVSKMQTKLHRWAVADPGRRFDDLFNLVHDPATLFVAWQRVVGNTGARSAGWTAAGPSTSTTMASRTSWMICEPR